MSTTPNPKPLPHDRGLQDLQLHKDRAYARLKETEGLLQISHNTIASWKAAKGTLEDKLDTAIKGRDQAQNDRDRFKDLWGAVASRCLDQGYKNTRLSEENAALKKELEAAREEALGLQNRESEAINRNCLGSAKHHMRQAITRVNSVLDNLG